MSKPLKINYLSVSESSYRINNTNRGGYGNCANNDDNIDLLVREYDSVDKTQKYNKCPVFKHKKNRTFIGYSPIDFKLGFDNGTLWTTDDDLIADINVVDPDFKGELVFQLDICNFAFWTDEPDVWIEYNSYPLTSLNNNFTVVEGWFNLSNWSRETSLAPRLVDRTKPLVIKKGDPLFRITFLSPDLNRGILLKERKGKLSEVQFRLSESKNYEEGNKLFSKTPNKCPFPFLKFLSK
jgi:hypothetical protein